MKELPVRKDIRLKEYDYSSAGCYFITVCVKDRHELLGEILVGDAVPSVPSRMKLSNIGKLVNAYLSRMNDVLELATLDCFAIMPNHVHLLISLQTERRGTLRTASPTKAVIPRIVHGMKSVTTRNSGYSIWQRSYHDHIIRDEAEYQKIWQYIEENPSRWTEDRYYKT